jgi:hypothetical protein
MRRLAAALLLLGACGSLERREPASLRVAYFESDATPPLGYPVFGKPIQAIQEPLLLKGIILEDRANRIVLAALDWCTMRAVAYREFRRKLAEAAGTRESCVAIHCIHTHSAPYSGDVEAKFLEEATDRAAAAARAGMARMQPFTQVGVGQAKVEHFASNRRVPGNDGKIRVRYSATKDASLRAEPEGLIDPWLRTVTLFGAERPIVRLHYYASHPQSFYGDGRAHPDTPGWARARLEKEEGIPHLYFTGCGGNVTAGKYNDGSPEARERLVDSLVAGMKGAIASTRREPVSAIAWKTSPVSLEWRTDAKAPEPTELQPPIDLSRLSLGPAEILGLPGEPFVEFQLHALSLRPDRFVAVAGYGDGSPGYICLDKAFSEGGYEPTAARVGPPTELRLKAAISDLLLERKSQ